MLSHTTNQCCIHGLMARGQGQGLVNLSEDKNKDFPRGQQHWVTVKNGLLTGIYQ